MGARLKKIIVEIYLLAAAQARRHCDVILGRVCVLLIVRQFETMGFIIDFYVKLCRWSSLSLLFIVCIFFSSLWELWARTGYIYFVCRIITKLQRDRRECAFSSAFAPQLFLFYLHRVRARADRSRFPTMKTSREKTRSTKIITPAHMYSEWKLFQKL